MKKAVAASIVASATAIRLSSENMSSGAGIVHAQTYAADCRRDKSLSFIMVMTDDYSVVIFVFRRECFSCGLSMKKKMKKSP